MARKKNPKKNDVKMMLKIGMWGWEVVGNIRCIYAYKIDNWSIVMGAWTVDFQQYPRIYTTISFTKMIIFLFIYFVCN